jgi:hypothetical protein
MQWSYEKKSIGESSLKIKCKREIKATGIENGSLKKYWKYGRRF